MVRVTVTPLCVSVHVLTSLVALAVHEADVAFGPPRSNGGGPPNPPPSISMPKPPPMKSWPPPRKFAPRFSERSPGRNGMPIAPLPAKLLTADSNPSGVVLKAASSICVPNELVSASAHAPAKMAMPASRTWRVVRVICLPDSLRDRSRRSRPRRRTSIGHHVACGPYAPLRSAGVRQPGRELVAQQLERPSHPCFHALYGDAELLGNFIIGHPTLPVHLEHLALRRGERRNGFLGRQPQLDADDTRIGRRRLCRPAHKHLATLRRARLTQPIESAIPRGLLEIGSDGIREHQRVPPPPQLEHPVLDDLLGAHPLRHATGRAGGEQRGVPAHNC